MFQEQKKQRLKTKAPMLVSEPFGSRTQQMCFEEGGALGGSQIDRQTQNDCDQKFKLPILDLHDAVGYAE